MPHRSIENVLAELQDEQHRPLVKLVSELSALPWARTLRYDLARLRLWIARKNIGRVEVMVTYADGRDGGRPSNSELDAYDISFFEAGAIVETVTLNARGSIDRIEKWLTDANRRLPAAEQQRAAAEAAIPIAQLSDAWLSADKRACSLLADRLEPPVLLRLAVRGLEACSQALGAAPPAVVEVIRTGTTPLLWTEAHKAFDLVRHLTLAAERGGATPEEPMYMPLLFVAESAARVIYNASLPRDPFDDDAAETLLHALARFARTAPTAERERIVRVLKSCFA